MAEVTQRMAQIPSKIPPGSAPRTPKIDPGTLPEHPELRKTTEAPQLAKKSRKSAESRSKEVILGPKWDPEIDKKATQSEKSAPQDGAGSGFHRFLGPSSFRITFQADFGTV